MHHSTVFVVRIFSGGGREAFASDANVFEPPDLIFSPPFLAEHFQLSPVTPGTRAAIPACREVTGLHEVVARVVGSILCDAVRPGGAFDQEKVVHLPGEQFLAKKPF